MSIFSRIYNFAINANLDAYMFDVMRYASMTDYVHDCGCEYKTLYVPEFNFYCHYYDDQKKFVVYKLEEPFNEQNPEYMNMRKVKVSARFCFELIKQYERDEESKQMAENKKEYFDKL